MNRTLFVHSLLYSTIVCAQVPTPIWWSNPANGWMKVPSNSIARQSDESSVRGQRDNYFDEIIGLSTPITSANAGTKHLSLGASIGTQPEVPDIPNRQIVIGDFTAYRSILSASGRSIYTEVTLRISEVLQDAGKGVKAGTDIILAIPGGSVQEKSGQVVSFLTDPREYFVQPGRMYLLVLSYNPEGDFYMLGKTWDMSTGIIVPDFATSPQDRAALNGMTRDEAIGYLRTTLALY